MLQLIIQYGLLLVFVNVLLVQLGLPLPAIPTLIVAGALAGRPGFGVPALLAVAFIACMLGDLIWYLAGRRFGRGVMALLCRVSLSPDSCVRQTEVRFERWGGLSLVLAKFVPGLATLAPPLAGAMGIGWWRYLIFDGIGSALWVGITVGVGWVFRGEIADLIPRIEAGGTLSFEVIGVLLAVYIAFKWWERLRFFRQLRIARISVHELHQLIDQGGQALVFDLRSPVVRESDRRFVPGALAMDLAQVRDQPEQIPKDRDIVFYCSCPNDATAASAAKYLIDLGYTRVRPLKGGIEAWVEAGYDVDIAAAQVPATALAEPADHA